MIPTPLFVSKKIDLIDDDASDLWIQYAESAVHFYTIAYETCVELDLLEVIEQEAYNNQEFKNLNLLSINVDGAPLVSFIVRICNMYLKCELNNRLISWYKTDIYLDEHYENIFGLLRNY